jgi:hypothetical protein
MMATGAEAALMTCKPGKPEKQPSEEAGRKGPELNLSIFGPVNGCRLVSENTLAERAGVSAPTLRGEPMRFTIRKAARRLLILDGLNVEFSGNQTNRFQRYPQARLRPRPAAYATSSVTPPTDKTAFLGANQQNHPGCPGAINLGGG